MDQCGKVRQSSRTFLKHKIYFKYFLKFYKIYEKVIMNIYTRPNAYCCCSQWSRNQPQ
uniref:Uncharacterized protein n=1 Tax=Meloidogyne enterolobii TaxID=390850 RepID=A0A6V7WYM4_MELEN|nr:unnamed protein product [Meloidogyne enterolobii]